MGIVFHRRKEKRENRKQTLDHIPTRPFVDFCYFAKCWIVYSKAVIV